jgi:hypothetical protein
MKLIRINDIDHLFNLPIIYTDTFIIYKEIYDIYV